MTACELFLEEAAAGRCLDRTATTRCRARCLKLLRRLDIPIVFALYDLTRNDARAFLPFDYVVVPSESARQHYWETLGLALSGVAAGDRPFPGGRERPFRATCRESVPRRRCGPV